MSPTCEFTNVDFEIKTQIIQACASQRLRRRALREPDISLADLLLYGQTLERSEQEAQSMERSSELPSADDVVNRAKTFSLQSKSHASKSHQKYSSQKLKNLRANPQKVASTSKTCFSCGHPYPHQNKCPAKNASCNRCHKVGHFARCCRTKSKQGANIKQSTKGVRPSKRTVCELDFDDNDVSSDVEVSECSDTSSESVWVLNFQQLGNETQEPNVITEPEITEISPNSSTRPDPGLSVPRVGKRPVVSNVNSFSKTRQPIVKIKIHNVNLQVLIDTGSSLNVIDKLTFDRLKCKDIVLMKSADRKILPYEGGDPITPSSKFETVVESKRKCTVATFYVVGTNTGAAVTLHFSTP